MPEVSVKLENELVLPASKQRVWDLVTDVPEVVPCIPGGRLLETVSESHWKAEVALDLGLTRIVFLADVVRRELDEAQGRAVLDINAVDAKGKSTARASMTSQLHPSESGTKVIVQTDVHMSGDVARFGAGIVEDVSYEMVEQMAARLEARLLEPTATADNSMQSTPTKLSLWAAIRMLLRGRLKRRRRRNRAGT